MGRTARLRRNSDHLSSGTDWPGENIPRLMAFADRNICRQRSRSELGARFQPPHSPVESASEAVGRPMNIHWRCDADGWTLEVDGDQQTKIAEGLGCVDTPWGNPIALGSRKGGANPIDGQLAVLWYADGFITASDPDPFCPPRTGTGGAETCRCGLCRRLRNGRPLPMERNLSDREARVSRHRE